MTESPSGQSTPRLSEISWFEEPGQAKTYLATFPVVPVLFVVGMLGASIWVIGPLLALFSLPSYFAAARASGRYAQRERGGWALRAQFWLMLGGGAREAVRMLRAA